MNTLSNTKKLDFSKADDSCKKHNGRLVDIRDPGEQVYIKALVLEIEGNPKGHTWVGDEFWIGATRSPSSTDRMPYEWIIDNTRFTRDVYQNWMGGEPNMSSDEEFCVAMWVGTRDTGTWNDVNCYAVLRAICKRPLAKDDPSSFVCCICCVRGFDC